MDLKLQNKVIIVTGGGSGIGAAVSHILAKEQAIVIILGRSEIDADFYKQIQELSSKSLFIKTDLNYVEDCRKAVSTVVEMFGSIYGLVNNAGVNDGIGLNAGPDAFKKSLNENLVHYYTMVHLCLSYIIKEKGAIVNISSKVAVTGQGDTSGYAAAKGAQLSLVREWACDLAQHGVRVNAVIPAESMTPLYEKCLARMDDPVGALKEIEDKIPLGKRMTTPEELAQETVNLLSPINAHTTGQWRFVDGGYTHLDRAL